MQPFAERPAVVGHRGSPLREVENTPASFARAAAEGASWVELDARRSRDGAVVVHHDPVTADGVPLVDRDAAELGELGIWELTAVLDGLAPGMGVDVELKNLPGDPDYDEDDRLAATVASLLAARWGTRAFLVSSFNPLTVHRFAETLPRCPVGLLFIDSLRMDAAMDVAGQVGATVLCPHQDVEDLDADAVGAAHAAGASVLVWTVDDPAQALRLAEAGVDAVCTNDPLRIGRALRGR